MIRSGRSPLAAALLAAAGTLAACGGRGDAPRPVPVATEAPGDTSYWLLVANEASDLVTKLAFVPPADLRTAAEIDVGVRRMDIDGVHGLRATPAGHTFLASIAHGVPFGRMRKLSATADTLLGEVELGRFPTTIEVTPNGRTAFIVNGNLHGDPTPSTVSVVHVPTMTELERVTTCIQPQGGRIDAAGRRHYSVCRHGDQLVAIDTRTFDLIGRMSLVPGEEAALPIEERGRHGSHATLDDPTCGPTWVAAGRGTRAITHVYVTCARAGTVVEIDVRGWTATRRFEVGGAPHQAAVTPDGTLLLATLRSAGSVVLIDLASGEELARIESTSRLPHGVALSPDGRYAFITNEGVGATPGTVDVVDIAARARVASTAVRYQPGAIDFWTMGR